MLIAGKTIARLGVYPVFIIVKSLSDLEITLYTISGDPRFK